MKPHYISAPVVDAPPHWHNPHITIGYFPSPDVNVLDGLKRVVRESAVGFPLLVTVTGTATIGQGGATSALLVQHPFLETIRRKVETIHGLDVTWPHFMPHITVPYQFERIATPDPLTDVDLRIGARAATQGGYYASTFRLDGLEVSSARG